LRERLSVQGAPPLIVALDVESREKADALIAQLTPEVSWFKIGLELFVAEGPSLVRDYASSGCRIFLDLKLHDIPATVARATARVAALGAELLTVHCAGGLAMMKAAVKAARATSEAGGRELQVLGVSALTSLSHDDLDAVGISLPIKKLVVQRAKLAVAAGCAGVVASPMEVPYLREVVPEEFVVITPGIRALGAPAGDQKRVMTPREAIDAGADGIVVGRPIRDANDPREAALAILGEIHR